MSVSHPLLLLPTCSPSTFAIVNQFYFTGSQLILFISFVLFFISLYFNSVSFFVRSISIFPPIITKKCLFHDHLTSRRVRNSWFQLSYITRSGIIRIENLYVRLERIDLLSMKYVIFSALLHFMSSTINHRPIPPFPPP